VLGSWNPLGPDSRRLMFVVGALPAFFVRSDGASPSPSPRASIDVHAAKRGRNRKPPRVVYDTVRLAGGLRQLAASFIRCPAVTQGGPLVSP
jgi:hypothetical protein